MPKGFQSAKKVGDRSGGTGFQPRPKGVTYFKLADQQSAVVRFLQAPEDIDWARKWKLAPNGNFRYGELVNCVDQLEDGTPDPGTAMGLKQSFKAYPTMIWRNAPKFQKDQAGKLIKDGLGNYVLQGHADTVALWECSYEVYSQLGELDAKYRGLGNLDWEIKRIGGGTDTKYMITPADPTQINVPLTPADINLAGAQRIDTAPFTKVPTYEELNTYLNGGVSDAPQPTFGQQAETNAAAGGTNPFLS